MLLHVVCARKLLVAAWVGALDRLLGSVDFRMTRGMARCREGLFTAVGVTIPTRVPLAWSFRRTRCIPTIVVVGIGADAFGIGWPLHTALLVRKAIVVIVGTRRIIIGSRCHWRQSVKAGVRVIRVGAKQLWSTHYRRPISSRLIVACVVIRRMMRIWIVIQQRHLSTCRISGLHFEVIGGVGWCGWAVGKDI